MSETSNPRPVRLTPAAQADLSNIWSYTAQNWSLDQADSYIQGLRGTLDLLAGNPEMARQRTEINPPVRVHRYKSHILIYRIEADHIAIIRIRHGREDWVSNTS